MKITCLVENTSSNEKIGAEHGLSLYIEVNDKKILFDMGQTDLFLKNASQLDVDLSEVDFAVLSHGHYDHGGGLKAFLDVNIKAPVYLSKFAFEPHYNGCEKYIGLDIDLKNGNRLISVCETKKILEGITLYHCNDFKKDFELGSFGLNAKLNEELVPDDFRHEQYLLIEENKKKILISGCSHKGILNIVKWFDADVVVGGFHFSKLNTDDTLKGYAQYLNDFKSKYYTCHCTGQEQYLYMKNFMDRLFYLSAGDTIII